MNNAILLTLPGFVCLFWAFAHWLLAPGTGTFRAIFLLLLAVFFTIAGDVLLEPLLGSDAIAHIFIYATAPSIIPLTCTYYYKLYKPDSARPPHTLWIIVPVVIATTSTVMTLVMGVDVADELLNRIHERSFNPRDPGNSTTEILYYYSTVFLFRGLIIIEFLTLLIYTHILTRRLHMRPRNLHNFLRHGLPIRLLELQMCLSNLIILIICLKLLLHASIFHDNLVWAFSIATVHCVLYFLFGLFALFGTKEYISLSDIRTLLRYNYNSATRSAVAEEIITDMSGYLSGESLTHVLSRLGTQHGFTPGRERSDWSGVATSLSAAVLNVVSRAQDDSGLAVQFRQLMQQERLYLKPGLTLSEVARRLGTNKTYLSKMVNQTYKVGFPEMLNILRVDYAQRYIRSHPDASQEEIAKASGFLSASSFNSTFKRISGFTPKVWTVRKDSAGQ